MAQTYTHTYVHIHTFYPWINTLADICCQSYVYDMFICYYCLIRFHIWLEFSYIDAIDLKFFISIADFFLHLFLYRSIFTKLFFKINFYTLNSNYGGENVQNIFDKRF